MNKGRHWTDRSVDDFVHRITFDFGTQIAKALEGSETSQADLAKDLGVSAGRVSQILNNPGNLGLKSVVKYARAIGRKVALVLYNDEDSANRNGPINSEVFSTCWEQAGRPADFFALSSAATAGFQQITKVVVAVSGTYTYLTRDYNSMPKMAFFLPTPKALPGPLSLEITQDTARSTGQHHHPLK
jgi:transcriptional regulator with XRE-family HTH domain